MNKFPFKIPPKGLLMLSFKAQQFTLTQEISSHLKQESLDSESLQSPIADISYQMTNFKITKTDPIIRAFLAFSASDEEVDSILYSYDWHQHTDHVIFTPAPTITSMLKKKLFDSESYKKLTGNPSLYVSEAKILKLQKFRNENIKNFQFPDFGLNCVKLARLLDQFIGNTIRYLQRLDRLKVAQKLWKAVYYAIDNLGEVRRRKAVEGRKSKSFRVVGSGRLSIGSMPTMANWSVVREGRQDIAWRQAKEKNLVRGENWPAGVKKFD
jgi:hypothetical protein